MKLNIGCGVDVKAGWVNIDVPVAIPSLPRVEGAELIGCDLDSRTVVLPFADNSVSEILASHVLEHIREVLPLMQELYRVAKPDCVMMAAVPYGSSDGTWTDPTHVRAFFIDTWRYFGQPMYKHADYGYRGDWKPIDVGLAVYDSELPQGMSRDEVLRKVIHERNTVMEMRCLMRAVKPPRERGVNQGEDACQVRIIRRTEQE